MANENYSKEVVAAVKEVIKELQEKHKANIKYRPYALDIHYELKRTRNINVGVRVINQILLDEKIVIPQPRPKKVEEQEEDK